MKPAQLQERLAARHLIPEETAALKEAVEEAVQPIDQAEEKKPDPREERVWTFEFKWTDGRGKIWDGSFTNKILSIAEQQLMAVYEARLCGGLAYASIDPAARNVNHAIAHMTYSLQDPPEWAKDLRKLDDPSLVIALYMEVASHEAKFFGLPTDQD